VTSFPIAENQPRTAFAHTVAPRERGYPSHIEALPDIAIEAGRYLVRFARSSEDLDRVLRLRFDVFNLELHEGLDTAYQTGRDEDVLDAHFHHLLIACRDSGAVVGTYRMQTAEMATGTGGFYSAGEFDLSTMPLHMLRHAVEIGRACVAREHRNGRVLHLLWRGLATYLAWNRKRYLFGCCSLNTQDPDLGTAVYQQLESAGHLHPDVRIEPLPRTACRPESPFAGPIPGIPALFESYLNLGARVCGPPAIDREFKTIDFLVMLDTDAMDPCSRRSFFR
jgi:putative hemolysin